MQVGINSFYFEFKMLVSNNSCDPSTENQCEKSDFKTIKKKKSFWLKQI